MYLYFIECAATFKPIKIGVSKHPKKRLKDLQTSNPFRLKLLEQVNCVNESSAYGIEEKLHGIFKRNCIRGEWFHPDCYKDALRLARKYAEKGRKWEEEIIPRDLDNKHLLEVSGIYVP